MPQYHGCLRKATIIQQRLKIFLGLDAHDVISEMCRMWGCKTEDEFYKCMDTMGDDELKACIEEARKNAKRRKLVREGQQEVTAGIT
ncbi:MAG: hypothetical protein HYU39_10785 [Thaumarchaeota archaeon]|nr:hypothetical protein [Nitrososphaerota archaeon]